MFFMVVPLYVIEAHSGGSLDLTAVPGEFIVRYKPGLSSTQSLGKTALSLNLKLKTEWTSISTYHLKTNTANSDQQILEELNKDPNVLIAEPNYLVKAFDLPYTPTTDKIQAPESWEVSSDYNSLRHDDSNVPIVAVIDTGLDTNHEIFKDTGRLWQNDAEAYGQPGVDDDNNGLVDDIHGWNFVDMNNNISDTSAKGHGTHVAGVVVASTEPLFEVDGQTHSRIKVMPLKFLNSDGVGKTSDAINAIYYAVNNGAKVLNNSWGGTGFSSALLDAIIYSYQQNAVFVAAAGNEANNNDLSPTYPANYDVPNLISVGASDTDSSSGFFNQSDGEPVIPALFSNYGSESVHISAPGKNVFSTLPGDDYGLLSGTSMAAPFISGLAALMYKEAPQHSGFQIKRDMLQAADQFSNLTGKNISDGRVNFKNSVILSQENSSEENFLPQYSPDYSSRGLASLANNGSMTTGCGRVKNLYKERNSINNDKNTMNEAISLIILIFPLIVIGLVRRKYEKRKYKRVNISCRGTFTTSKSVFHVLVKDISVGGAGVEIIGPITKGASIEKVLSGKDVKGELEIHFDGDEQSPKKILCHTTSAREYFVGLAFD